MNLIIEDYNKKRNIDNNRNNENDKEKNKENDKEKNNERNNFKKIESNNDINNNNKNRGVGKIKITYSSSCDNKIIRSSSTFHGPKVTVFQHFNRTRTVNKNY